MSLNLYGVLETYDRHGAGWEYFSLYKKNEKGEFVEADLMSGGRSCVDAVFGRDYFDYPDPENEDDEFSPKGKLLDAVSMIIQEATVFNIDNECSKETLEKLDKYISEGSSLRVVVYTLYDINLMKLLASQASDRAAAYFDTYFRQVEAALLVASAVSYSFSPKDVRIILFGI